MQQPLIVCLLTVTLLSGCKSTLCNTYSSLSASSAAHSFLDCTEDQQARLNSYLAKYGADGDVTEREKIDYLLAAVNESELTFIRNGYQVDGSKASKWLRWKMRLPQFRDNPIDTADAFVNRVADRSLKTGVPYEAILPGGQRARVQHLLAFELKALETALIARG